jgi:hypothetical protein
MSLRYEQYWSLLRTREFLKELLTRPGRWTKKEMRAETLRCLRHYPPLTAKGQPMWSRDEFTEDEKV